jgi:hypothetical protein
VLWLAAGTAVVSAASAAALAAAKEGGLFEGEAGCSEDNRAWVCAWA